MKADNMKYILSQKETPEPDGDFEDRLMARIRRRSAQMAVEKKYARLMYSFFALGLAFGLVLSLFMGNITIDIRDASFVVNRWFLQLPVVAILLFVFEKLYQTRRPGMRIEE